ncbi:unnamed protein product, partial [Dibothriocephalus latus]
MPFSPGAKLPELPFADQHFLSDPKSALDFLTEARAEFEAAALLGTTGSTGSAPVGSNSLPLSVSQLLGALVGITGLGDANKFGGPPTAGLLPPSVLAASDPLLNAVLKLVNPLPPPPPSSAEVFSTTPT